MHIGLFVSTGGHPSIDRLLERFVRAEALGFDTAWVGQVFGHDALTLLALAGRVTRRIELGSWVVPTPLRHPVALAQQAATVQAATGGRLALGVGAGHAAIVGRRLGLDARRPYSDLLEFLCVLQPLLREGRVEHAGARYRVRVELDRLGTTPPPVLVGALGPRMLELAGRRCDGAALWLAGPRALEEYAIPQLRRTARVAGRPDPRIAVGLPIAVTGSRIAGCEGAEALVARSARLPAYRRILEREGASRPGEVAIVGDEAEVASRLDALAALGVTDFNAVTFEVASDPAAVERTVELLASRSMSA